jgi:microcystin-dependent protein
VDEYYLAEIRLFAGNFEPRDWMFCDGRELRISDYTALYALLGTNYGGNGYTTFCLPDLRGRVAVGAGQGTGLTFREQGDIGGMEQAQLTVAQIPAHSHSIAASSQAASTAIATNGVFAVSDGGDAAPAYRATAPDTTLANDAVTLAGYNRAHSNMQPALALNHIICVCGCFPRRD